MGQSFQDIGNHKETLLDELHEVKRVHKGWTLSLEELSHRSKFSFRIRRATLMEEISWRQKSLVL